MDNREDKQNNKQNNEQKEKRPFKMNKAKSAEFFKRNGFYIALFICIAAAGLTAVLSLTGSPPEQQQYAVTSDGQQVENPGDKTLEEEQLSRLTSPTPSPSVTPSPSASASPSASPTATKNPGNKPGFTLAAPLQGKIIREFMIDKLTYNKTLKQWATHNGVDIQGSEGDPIKAALSGTVEAAYTDQLYGGVVIITHDNNRKTVYAGVAISDKIKEGTKVNSGQTLGTLKTPNFEAYLGAHLHFELMEGTNNLDPASTLNKYTNRR